MGPVGPKDTDTVIDVIFRLIVAAICRLSIVFFKYIYYESFYVHD